MSRRLGNRPDLGGTPVSRRQISVALIVFGLGLLEGCGGPAAQLPPRKRAGVENFTFDDLEHTDINNWRLQGHDYFRIMAATGHKTMTVFQRARKN
jgi:hypothetical protein